MLGQLNMQGKNKIEVAIDRIKMFEPEDGYYLAFSGGKDSIVCKELLKMAGVKYDAHYNHTTVDPPELIRYIREHHSEVEVNWPEKTMWRLIEDIGTPPTRLARYCCRELKEGGGENRFVVTGVRWAESARRKNTRKEVEFFNLSKSKATLEYKEVFLMSDNDEKRNMTENCTAKGKFILNPIIDWEDDDVWEFIHQMELPYCELYDQGYERLGCIGCPMGSSKQKEAQFDRCPKYKQSYIRAFDRMLIERQRKNMVTEWKTGEEVMKWWIGGKQ